MLIPTVNRLLGILTILGQIVLLSGIFYYLFFGRKRPGALIAYISKNGLRFAFSVSLAATLGSLFFSEVAGFDPCKLCWFQRIFMYPQTILLGLALFKKDRRFADYGLALAIVGASISFYHNYLSYKQTASAVCGPPGAFSSCIRPLLSELGYIDIPLMALTAFLLIISLLVLQRKSDQLNASGS